MIEIRSFMTGMPLYTIKKEKRRYFIKKGAWNGDGTFREATWEEVKALVNRMMKKGHRFYLVGPQYEAEGQLAKEVHLTHGQVWAYI